MAMVDNKINRVKVFVEVVFYSSSFGFPNYNGCGFDWGACQYLFSFVPPFLFLIKYVYSYITQRVTDMAFFAEDVHLLAR